MPSAGITKFIQLNCDQGLLDSRKSHKSIFYLINSEAKVKRLEPSIELCSSETEWLQLINPATVKVMVQKISRGRNVENC